MLFVLTCCLFCFCYRLFVVCVFFCVVTERAKVFAGILCSLWDLIIHSGPLFLLCYPFVVTVFWFLVGLTNPKNYLPSFSKTLFLLLCLSAFLYGDIKHVPGSFWGASSQSRGTRSVQTARFARPPAADSQYEFSSSLPWRTVVY